MERYSSFKTAGSPIEALPSDRGEERSSSSERSAAKEFAERVGSTSLPTYAELEQQFKSEQAEQTFASEVESCKEIGVRFLREPGPDGTYRIDTDSFVDTVRSPTGALPRLAGAALAVDRPKTAADVVRLMKRLRFPYEDRNYPFWRQTYDHVIEKLDSQTEADLKKELGIK